MGFNKGDKCKRQLHKIVLFQMLLIQINQLKTLRHYPSHKHRWDRITRLVCDKKRFGSNLHLYRKERFGQFGPLEHLLLLLPYSSNYKNLGNL